MLTLAAAVLIYRGAGGGALATVHDVHRIKGESVIGAGKPMTPRKAIDLSRALRQGAAHAGFLPANVLFVGGDVVLWWEPPQRRHITFRVDAAHLQVAGRLAARASRS